MTWNNISFLHTGAPVSQKSWKSIQIIAGDSTPVVGPKIKPLKIEKLDTTVEIFIPLQ